mmetsp:Transcript_82612/g.151265  ORF Transcript_82612/g.151265 Transcript_82612/m.151265 type:complete len:378 (-) Transcript_82612:82-1215(-)
MAYTPAYSVAISGSQNVSGVVRYVIAVSNGESSWYVMRRYSEIEALRKSLEYFMRGLPAMPSKSLFFRKNFSASFMEERQRQLNAVLQSMVSADPHLSICQLRQFLEAPPAPLVAQSETAVPCSQASCPTAPAAPSQAVRQEAPAAACAQAIPVVAASPMNLPRAAAPGQPPYAANAHASAQPVYAVNAQPAAQPPYYMHAQPYVQTGYAPQPAYRQQAPAYAQPPAYAHPRPYVVQQPLYGPQPPMSSGAGMAVAAGMGGLAAGAVGGMMLESALENRCGMWGPSSIGGGFGGGNFREVQTGIFGDQRVVDVRTDMWGDEQITDVRRDVFGDTEVRTEVIDRDIFGNVTDVREEIVDRDMFGNVTRVEDDTFFDDW